MSAYPDPALDTTLRLARIETKVDRLVSGEALGTLLARAERIEAKLDRLINGPLPDIIPIREVMRLTGAQSLTAAYRMTRLLGIRPYVRGKYRRPEVENAIARKALNDRLAASRR